MQHLWRAGQLLRYLIDAQGLHGTHSPSVYALLNKAIYRPAKLEAIDAQRLRLRNDPRTIEVTDLGAGSNINPSKKRAVADIARHSAKQPRYARLLFNLANHFQPKTMVELGTSLGVSGLSQALASPNGHLHTLEGCPQTANLARETFNLASAKNVTVHVGNFDQTLGPLLQQLGTIDWAFVDGNHRGEATLRYARQFLAHAHSGTVLLFDDIHWSIDMLEAWQTIRTLPEVTVSLDLFQVGVVLLHGHQAKEHFTIRY